ncbi:unnamed protein product [Symbiodinium pilosum]|uniref:Uncharacterized protein n=1 Tax=Symbiodinium pilosum TaxID=2952 RepID=A0A812QSS9_SYMPI|nr:unnamed protein product [Symbiodinium pilosum]
MVDEKVNKPGVHWKALLALIFLAVACALQGCEDFYRQTCVWHSDLNIKGCSYYGFRGCIQHCTYCLTPNGPDECAQMKCAAYCAGRENADCMRNYAALCNIALEEGFKANTSTGSTYYTCDVQCSSARAASVALPLALTLAASGIPKRFLVLGGVLAWMTSLQGCGCSPPSPQLSWRPDSAVFDERTRRVVDGIWMGNPSWVWWPELESEDYQCVDMHPTLDICASWTSHEWNCGEHDFGMCKCFQLDANNRYCEKWSCHSLEADQEICHHTHSENGEDGVQCYYNAFPMNYDVYNQIMEQQAGGWLTTGENAMHHWWRPTSLWRADIGRRLGEEELLHKPEEEILSDYVGYLRQHNASEVERLEKLGVITDPRRLAGTIDWPPLYAYSPAARHLYFRWGDVCIVNGDNVVLAKRYCNYWREIETEIQICECRAEDVDGRSCARWTCEDRDVGLFSVLFRTTQSIDQYTEGVEFESYTCTRTNVDGECVSWQGDISSLEEVEWTSCQAVDASTHRLGAVWVCDEWELPKTRDLFYESNIGILCTFIFIELFVVCCLARSVDEDGDALFLTACLSWSIGLCLLPFLVLTLGFYGFLFAGGVFWLGRFCCCGVLCMMNLKLPESVRAERPSNRVRMQRGASKILGRQTSSIMPSTKTAEATNETNETNQNNDTNQNNQTGGEGTAS